MILTVTGHRTQKIRNPENIKNKIRDVIGILKPKSTITGMALGVDLWFADICYNLNIPYVAAIPFWGQHFIWPKEEQNNYMKYLDRASSVVRVSNGGYAGWKYQVRNEWMIDRCDKLLAIWDGSRSGTKNAIDYAKSKDIEIIRIKP